MSPSTASDTRHYTGELIGGKYQLMVSIGESGHNEVWKAHNIRGGGIVAVKLLRNGLTGGDLEQAAACLKLEQRTLPTLKHPGIVKFEAAIHDPLALVMEHVPGTTLSGAQFTGRPWKETARLMRQLAGTLAWLHAQTIVHRDVQPDNVMVTPPANGAEQTKLLDFGDMCGKGSLLPTEDGDDYHRRHNPRKARSTFAYASPDRLRGSIEPPIDVFAFGVIFYGLLSGKLPYLVDDLETDPDLLLEHYATVPVRSLNKEVEAGSVPAGVAELVMGLITLDPHKRLTAAATVERLDYLSRQA
jgi:serine/threonine protein kinase